MSGLLENIFQLYDNNHDTNNKIQQNILYKNTIGDITIPFQLKRKCYISCNEECPICYDAIITKQNAYITPCGHSYHKKCLFNYIQKKREANGFTSVLKCPMCRSRLGYPDIFVRYKNNFYDCENGENNLLDKLEDFWITKEYRIPDYCFNGQDHYLGMKNTCLECKYYQKTGEIKR